MKVAIDWASVYCGRQGVWCQVQGNKMALQDMIDLLLTRRSLVARDMCEPGPSAQERDVILQAGARVPDHGKLGPWRFVIFEGDARQKCGEHLASIFLEQEPDADAERVQMERDRLLRAPLVIAVISCVVDHPKIPEWEQLLSVGAVCQNMLLAASAMGYGAQWLTEWYAFDDEANAVLGLREGERTAGYLYFGSMTDKPGERARPALEERVSFWGQS